MGTYDYIWEHHMEHFENHLKLEEYIWEHLAYLQEFPKNFKKFHQAILFPKRKKPSPFELVPARPLATWKLNSHLYSAPHFTQVKTEGQTCEEHCKKWERKSVGGE
jgi:hypothetical protein